ncbi:hypothetical protein [Shouchella clausii]|uniref:hypothetical protein n=1 Tax=Shouchella clausii TaxID=79880 RepID=UPI001C731D8C|nr:hypothetical protein [Shouchella clausii]MBX0320226.1 hypothetical protein [Shouchella clausii]
MKRKLLNEKVEVFTKVDPTNVRVKDHAVQRARAKGNNEKVRHWIISKFRNADFITVINSSKYGAARLFQYDSISLIVDLQQNLILTVYKSEATKWVKNRVLEFCNRELEKVSRKLRKIKNKNSKLIADLKVEKEILARDYLYMRSQAKKNAAEARIKAIEMEIEELSEEIFELERAKSEFTITLASRKNVT